METNTTNTGTNSTITSEWAMEQYNHGLEVLTTLSPSEYINSIQQGDVLASASGNLRLVLNIRHSTSSSNVSFLSLLKNGVVTLENAVQNKIAASKLIAIIRRKEGNPLEKFAAMARNLENERFAFHNTQILLGSGDAGSKLQSAIRSMRSQKGDYGYINIWIDSITGKIDSIENNSNTNSSPMDIISLSFNLNNLPSLDYIKSVRIHRQIDPESKNNILVSCILANTIANANNLLTVGKIVERK